MNKKLSASLFAFAMALGLFAQQQNTTPAKNDKPANMQQRSKQPASKMQAVTGLKEVKPTRSTLAPVDKKQQKVK